MLFTIGYEGATVSDFIATLKATKVSHVVDIRDRPQSRRPGFSKTALQSELIQSGICYVHVSALGDPKPGRDAARAGDYATFRAIFGGVLASDMGQTAVKAIAAWAKEDNVCLLCYERNPDECHRKLVAASIEAINKERTQHLGVQSREQVERATGRMRDFGQGASA